MSDDAEDQNTWVNFFLHIMVITCIPAVVFIALCCCCKNRRSHSDLVAEQRRLQAELELAMTQADPDDLRVKVLQVIFPSQKLDTSVLKYDPESKTYNWTNEGCGDILCSICLENFEPWDVTVSSMCSHAYHRDCIMAWLKAKDECPNCRQVMWDTETFDSIEADILLANSCAAEEPITEAMQLNEEEFTNQPGVFARDNESHHSSVQER